MGAFEEAGCSEFRPVNNLYIHKSNDYSEVYVQIFLGLNV